MQTKQTIELERGDVVREFAGDAWRRVVSAEIVPFTGAVHTLVRFANGTDRRTGSVMPWQVADDVTPIDDGKRPRRERRTATGLHAGDRIRYLLKDDQGGPAWRECVVTWEPPDGSQLLDVRHDDGECEGIGLPWPVQVRRDRRWR